MPLMTHAAVELVPANDLLEREPHLRSLAQQLSLAYVHRQVVTEAFLQRVGEQLWRALQPGDRFDHALQAAGARVLPLVLRSDSALIQSLPWETLYHPQHGFLGRHPGFTLRRRWNLRPAPAEPPPVGPLKVLLFNSLPEDLDAEKERLDLETERDGMLEALLPLIQDGLVELTCPDDGTFANFQRLLRENFHLVLLSGHGAFQAAGVAGQPARAAFLFETADGQSDPVEARRLAEAFRGSATRAVVLSACQSGKSAAEDLSQGLTGAVVSTGVPFVIGMRESVFDQAGIRFAHAFCGALGERESVDVALQRARIAIAGNHSPDDTSRRQPEDHGGELTLGQWCLPLLASSADDQRLVSWGFTPQPPRHGVQLKLEFQGISQPAHYIGRKRALAELGRLFGEARRKPVLITGVGGQGKTSLAGAMARRWEAKGWAPRAWSARHPASWEEFITELKLDLGDALRDRVERRWADCRTPRLRAKALLGAWLEQTQGRWLVFFDNLESIQDEQGELTHPEVGAWVGEIVARGAGGPLLVLTSRRAIPSLAGQIEPYPLPRPGYGDFLRFVRELNLGRRLPALWRKAYRALGGNFKGLELFARAGALGADEESFLARVEAVQEELNAYAAIRETVALLTPPERELLERLRAYETAVIEDGVRKVASDRRRVAEQLARLVNLSLVEPARDGDTGLVEYLVTPLAGEWLERNAGQLTLEVLGAAADYQVYAMWHLRPTIAQAMVAHRALSRAQRQEDAHDLVLRILAEHLSLRGLNRALVDEWLPPLVQSSRARIRANALNRLGNAWHSLGDYDRALDYLQQSLAIQREIGDKQGEGATLNNLSAIAHARGDYDRALDYLQQSLAIRREIGDKQGEGVTLNNLATTAHARGDYDRALDYLRQSLAIRREIGDKKGEGVTLSNLSQIYQARGDYDRALDYLQQALAIQREIGDKKGEGTTLNNLSAIAHARGDYDRALDYLQQSLAILREIGDKRGEGTTLNNLSQIYDARGDYDRALDHLQQSLAIRREIGDKQGEGTTLNNLSQIYDARGDYDRALDYLQQSLAITREIGDKQGEGTTLNNLSAIAHARGDYDRALDYLQQSLAIRREIGDLGGLCATLFNIGHIHLQKQERQEALAAWIQVYRLARQLGEAQALAALDQLARSFGQDGLEFWESLSARMPAAD
jgi:tetratricopeptide (TPR) repeat protein